MVRYSNTKEDNIELLIDLANEALEHLNKAKEHLTSAKKWGIVDMVGGGLVMTMVKHNKINAAKQSLAQADSCIHILEQKLLYLNYSATIDVSIGDFSTVADYLFDNPLTDALIQTRISDSLDKVNVAISRVENILDELYAGGGEAA